MHDAQVTKSLLYVVCLFFEWFPLPLGGGGQGGRGYRVRNRGWRVRNRGWRGREAGVEGAGSGDRGGGESRKIGAGK